MTTTETHPPGTLATARRDRAQGCLDRLRLALDEAERGGATVMRIDAVRATVAESGGAG